VKLIRSDRAATQVQPGDPWLHQKDRRNHWSSIQPWTVKEKEGDTTCFAVVDRYGNAVCQLQSLQSPVGYFAE
jgi:gamma-glutamyltranspeptidase